MSAVISPKGRTVRCLAGLQGAMAQCYKEHVRGRIKKRPPAGPWERATAKGRPGPAGGARGEREG